MERRASMSFCAVGAALIAVYYLLPSPGSQAVVYSSIGLIAAGAVLVGTRRHRPARPAAWYLLAATLALWSAGDALWSWYDVQGGEAPLLSIADVFYLAAYPALGAGALLMVRARRPGRDVEGLVDGLLMAVVATAALWMVAVQPQLGGSADGLAGDVVAIAYPMADVVVMAVLTRLMGSPTGRSPAPLLLMAGLGLTLLGDLVYLVQVQQGTFVSASWVDATWVGGYVLVGAAAVHPSMRTLTEPGQRERPDLSRLRLVMIGAGLLALALMWAFGMSEEVDRRVQVFLAIALVVLIVWRMGVVVADKDAQLAERLRAEAALRARALTDPLTGLANRQAFVESTEAALAGCRHSGGAVGVLFLDLDHFKIVNDTLGHQVGDEVLKVVAARFEAVAGPGDLVARFGGDEFTVLCRPSGSGGTGGGTASLRALAERLVAVAQEPVAVAGRTLAMGASIGLATSTGGQGDAHRLLREADTAMYEAKALGRGTTVAFDDRLRQRALHRLDIEARLREAADHGELRLVYQPEVVLETGEVFGVEALVRWDHPERGLLGPGEFIDVAEESGLILGIGEWVLRTACHQARAWEREAGRPVPLAVNVSSRQLADPAIVDVVASALAESGLAASSLFLEITESALIGDKSSALATLTALKDLGLSIAVDDFGTGYFSLSQLKRFPIDIVKVDRGFVTGVEDDPADAAIVAATINLAHGLGMIAVAEGVETPAQVAALRGLGCDVVQGFLYARPGEGDAVPELLDRFLVLPARSAALGQESVA